MRWTVNRTRTQTIQAIHLAAGEAMLPELRYVREDRREGICSLGADDGGLQVWYQTPNFSLESTVLWEVDVRVRREARRTVIDLGEAKLRSYVPMRVIFCVVLVVTLGGAALMLWAVAWAVSVLLLGWLVLCVWLLRKEKRDRARKVRETVAAVVWPAVAAKIDGRGDSPFR